MHVALKRYALSIVLCVCIHSFVILSQKEPKAQTKGMGIETHWMMMIWARRRGTGPMSAETYMGNNFMINLTDLIGHSMQQDRPLFPPIYQIENWSWNAGTKVMVER